MGAEAAEPKAADGAAASPHPHELLRCEPRRRCCGAAGRARVCSGCGDGIPAGTVWYECGLKPKPCDYVVCIVCFNLGPGEGGIIQTASFDKLPSLTPEVEVASPTPQTSSNSMEFPVRAAPSQPPAETKNLPPRVRAAGRDFGLSEDTPARESWQRFVEHGGGSKSDAGPELLALARRAARHLHFLQLTVLSQEALYAEQESRQKDRCLELYSPLAGIPSDVKVELIESARKVPHAERSMGSLVGMAVGDALGAPFEFLDAVDSESSSAMFNLKRFQGHGARNKFKVLPGQWTDDASMGLCLADSLLARLEYDGSDARIRFHNWWFRGYNNAFGNDSRIGSVGLGSNVAKSLRAMAPGKKPTPRYEARTQDAGNGTIMRLAAVPIFYARDPVMAAEMSAASSSATHPGPIAAAAAAFLGFAIASAIERGPEPMTAKAFLDSVVEDFTQRGCPGAGNCKELLRLLKSEEPRGGKEECWNWRAHKLQVESSLMRRGEYYNGYLCTANYFGSYCMDGLAVAMWCFYNTAGFAEAIVRCTNFLGDADTTSAICGQLAGAFYGYGAIDRRWIEQLERWDNSEIACRAALLCSRRALAS